MSALSKSLLLFVLNLLDAKLTLLWVKMGVATEGNGLMARLLEAGDAHFLLVKMAAGAFAAYALWRWSHLTLARRGLHLVLGLYLALMLVHAATGATALGSKTPERVILSLAALPENLLALFS